MLFDQTRFLKHFSKQQKHTTIILIGTLRVNIINFEPTLLVNHLQWLLADDTSRRRVKSYNSHLPFKSNMGRSIMQGDSVHYSYRLQITFANSATKQPTWSGSKNLLKKLIFLKNQQTTKKACGKELTYPLNLKWTCPLCSDNGESTTWVKGDRCFHTLAYPKVYQPWSGESVPCVSITMSQTVSLFSIHKLHKVVQF